METTPHYFTNKDVQFHDLLFEYMELVAEGLYSSDKYADVWKVLTEMLYEGEVSPAAFIRCASEVFRKYPYQNFGVHLIFDNLVWTHNQKKPSYSYPELLWIVVRENLLNDLSTTQHIFDAINHFSKIIDRGIVRAYLNYALINEDEAKHADLVRSYYYTGHTVDSLKLVEQVVRFPEDDFNLLDYHYGNAMSFVFNPRSASLTPDEKSWLKAYFTKGLAIGHSEISDSCHKALAQLEKL